jgi:hypothetical protein
MSAIRNASPWLNSRSGAELLALVGVGDGQVERRLSQPRGRRGDAEAAGVEGGEGDRHALALGADPAVGGDADSVEDHLATGVAVQPHLASRVCRSSAPPRRRGR